MSGMRTGGVPFRIAGEWPVWGRIQNGLGKFTNTSVSNPSIGCMTSQKLSLKAGLAGIALSVLSRHSSRLTRSHTVLDDVSREHSFQIAACQNFDERLFFFLKAPYID